VKNVSAQSLYNVALHYLRRYSATKKGLETVLTRRVKNHIRLHGGEVAEGLALIPPVVERMIRAGYIDDARFAEARVSTLRRQGKGVRWIRLKLRQKGVESDVVDQATALTVQDELEAALILVNKRKLGRDAERKQKDLAVLMRAGFSYEVSKQALQCTVPT
jgi:regulatory protein